MTKKDNKKEQIWIALFLVMPATILSKLSNEFADSSLNRILFAGLFGGVGGLLGAGLFQLVKTKTTAVKTVSVILLTGLCITPFVVIKLNKPALQTCEICGYKGIAPGKKECGYCGCLTWDEQRKTKDYDDKQEWLRDEQLFLFSLDSTTQQIDFFNPSEDDGFKKDKNWKPVITQQDLMEDFVNAE